LKSVKKIIKFGDYLQHVNGKVREGIGAIEGGQYQYLFISSSGLTLKKRDVWVLKQNTKNGIIAEHRFSRESMLIPHKSLVRGLRRISGLDKIDVTDNLDFIITKSFPEIDRVLQLFEGKKRDLSFIKKWEKHVMGTVGNVAFMRRFDISAPGSRLLAFYSSIYMAPLGVMWAIKVPDHDAKILSLWLNSTINILQVLRERKETRGAFLQIDGYTLQNMWVLNCISLSNEEKSLLLTTFDELKDLSFPSILDQLRNKFHGRVLLDKVILRILGYDEYQSVKLIEYLYSSLRNEIERLKSLMEGK